MSLHSNDRDRLSSHNFFLASLRAAFQVSNPLSLGRASTIDAKVWGMASNEYSNIRTLFKYFSSRQFENSILMFEFSLYLAQERSRI